MAMFSNAWQSLSTICGWEVVLQCLKVLDMETRFVLESTYGITHYVRSIPITLSVLLKNVFFVFFQIVYLSSSSALTAHPLVT